MAATAKDATDTVTSTATDATAQVADQVANVTELTGLAKVPAVARHRPPASATSANARHRQRPPPPATARRLNPRPIPSLPPAARVVHTDPRSGYGGPGHENIFQVPGLSRERV